MTTYPKLGKSCNPTPPKILQMRKCFLLNSNYVEALKMQSAQKVTCSSYRSQTIQGVLKICALFELLLRSSHISPILSSCKIFNGRDFNLKG